MHAVLSPSGAHRFMRCPGSAALESAVPNVSSVYADEGTAAHTLATWALLEHRLAASYIGRKIQAGAREFEVTTEMAEFVQGYVDYVHALADGCLLFVEQRVPVDHLTGEEGAEGTADVIIINPAKRWIIGIDLKYGMGVRVDAEGNEQTRIYGLGSLRKFDYLCDFEIANLIIYQPRLDHISSETISITDLLSFGEDVTNCAVIATEALALFQAGATPEELDEAGYLAPGEEQCRWCNAKATCPALLKLVGEMTTGVPATMADFATALEPVVPDHSFSPGYLGALMDKVPLVEDWCKAIRAETERRLFEGQDVPGYKIVQGKMGDRKWLDATAAETSMRAMKIKVSDMFNQSLISPTAAEKLLKKPHPSRWEDLQKHITRAPGKPSVAPVTDDRPAMALVATAADFGGLISTE